MPISPADLAQLDTFIRIETLQTAGQPPTYLTLQAAIDAIDNSAAPEGSPPGALQLLDNAERAFYGSDGVSGIIGALYGEGPQ